MTNVLKKNKNKNDAYINEFKHGKTYFFFNLSLKCIMYFIENFNLIKIKCI